MLASARVPPQKLCAGHVLRRLKFALFCGGFRRCSDFAWHGRDFAQASSDFMQPRADFAQSRGDFAQPCTDFAQIYGDFTQPRVDFAQVRGDFAQARGDFERCCLHSSCLCTGFYEYQCVFLRRFPSFFSFLSCECPPQVLRLFRRPLRHLKASLVHNYVLAMQIRDRL